MFLELGITQRDWALYRVWVIALYGGGGGRTGAHITFTQLRWQAVNIMLPYTKETPTKVICTLGPACCKFGWDENPVISRKFLWVKITDSDVTTFRLNEQFSWHLFMRSTLGPVEMQHVWLHYFRHIVGLYRSGTVNSKSFVGKVSLRLQWKFELTYAL